MSCAADRRVGVWVGTGWREGGGVGVGLVGVGVQWRGRRAAQNGNRAAEREPMPQTRGAQSPALCHRSDPEGPRWNRVIPGPRPRASGAGNRTRDQRVKSSSLCQLS